MRRLAPVLLLLLPTLASAALGADSPPPGIKPQAWAELWKRAQWAAKAAKKLVPSANEKCLEAVFADSLGAIEVGMSLDPASDLPATVKRSKATEFKDALKKNREDNCKDPDGGATALAVAELGAHELDWQTVPLKRALNGQVAWLYERHRSTTSATSRFVHGLLSLGVLVPAAEGAAVPAGVPLPILNPALFPMRDTGGGT